MGMVWKVIQPTGGDYNLVAGGRYAALVSLSHSVSMDTVRSKASSMGLDLTYLWEQGDPSRALYQIDDYLAGLAPDTTSNHRWVYGEANASTAVSIPEDPPWPFTIFHVAWVNAAVQSSGPGDLPPAPPPPGSSSSSSSGLGIAAAVGAALGLGVVLARRR